MQAMQMYYNNGRQRESCEKQFQSVMSSPIAIVRGALRTMGPSRPVDSVCVATEFFKSKTHHPVHNQNVPFY